MPQRIAYMPVNTYPEAAEDSAILAAVGFASAVGCGLHVTTYAVDVPKTASSVAGLLINVEAMAAAVEERSKTECVRLQSLVTGAARPGQAVVVNTHNVVLGAALDAATTEARTHDLALLPWNGETVSAQDMAQALVFDAGVPVILVPSSATTGPVDHIAVAWDGSRVAARALCDALPLLSAGGQISVLTVVGGGPSPHQGTAGRKLFESTRAMLGGPRATGSRHHCSHGVSTSTQASPPGLWRLNN